MTSDLTSLTNLIQSLGFSPTPATFDLGKVNTCTKVEFYSNLSGTIRSASAVVDPNKVSAVADLMA